MRTIFAEYNPKRNSIDVYTSVGYMLRIDCSPTAKDCIKCRPKCVPRSPAYFYNKNVRSRGKC